MVRFGISLRATLLPVAYFMVTFTLRARLRGLAWGHPRTVFDLLMRVAGTLRDFARTPGGGGRYLFNGFALARAFRVRKLQALNEAGLAPPAGLPDKWIVHCQHVVGGAPALDHLSGYLYRGVVCEASLLEDRDGRVTFRSTDGRTGELRPPPPR